MGARARARYGKRERNSEQVKRANGNSYMYKHV